MKLVIAVISFLIALLPKSVFAYVSDICKGNVCQASEVGRFMQGIPKECGNLGNCSLDDIMIVFSNVSLFILGVIGSLVLLMYVIGGFYWLTSRGDPGDVKKGKDYIKISTTGLIIVLFAYVFIEFLLRSLTQGAVKIGG